LTPGHGRGIVTAMYAVIVRVRVTPGSAARFIELSRANQRGSQQEPGNRRWELLQVLGDPERFILDEQYVDEAAFKAHQQTAHYLAWREAVAPLMAEPRQAEKAAVVAPA
jgi:autoinducer 2-degrading protein